MRLFSALLGFALLTLPTLAAAQSALLPPDDPIEVMVLGTFHFATPNADVAQFRGIDVLSDKRQVEIEAVVDQLLAFEATHVAVESSLGWADTLDARYGRYQAGRFELPANEIYQLGFRLADGLGHEGVHPIDFRSGMDFDSLMTYAAERDTAFVAWFEDYTGEIVGIMNRLQQEESIVANLRYMNTPEGIATTQLGYVMLPAVGAGDTYVGAYVASQWYERNLRIFGNVASLAEPGDRVLLIVGAGHAPVLRQFIDEHPGMVVVEPNAYLFP